MKDKSQNVFEKKKHATNTTLSKYIWKQKEKYVNQAPLCNFNSKNCRLCLEEKLV